MLSWLAALATIAVVVVYEVSLAVAQRRYPDRLARPAHAALREQWFAAVSAQKGSEVLAVQTLRNSLMSAAMIASTSVLGLMGTLTLAAPSLRATLGEGDAGLAGFTPRLASELVLLMLLFASLVSSAMAVRYYNHAGFVVGMPVESETRRRWTAAGSNYVRRAGVLYSWSLRHLILVVPVVAFLVHPGAGPVAAVLVVGVLFAFDRFQPELSSAGGR
jgi:uncharacterized membrane protein